MGKILVPGQTDLSGKPQNQQIKATVLFQDQNYTIMRNKEGTALTQQDIFDTPLHLILIGCGMLDARTYVSKIGKDNFLLTLKKLKKQFDDNYKKQKAIANNMKVEKPVAKPFQGDTHEPKNIAA